MKKAFLLAIVALFAGAAWLFSPLSIEYPAALANDSEQAPAAETARVIEVYTVPSSFQRGYFDIIAQLIESNESVRYPEPLSNDFLIDSATDQSAASTLPQSASSPVQYEAQKNLLIVLATKTEHKQIKQFLSQLEETKVDRMPVMYRMAFVERDIHPKLKDYPFEFFIRGKCWDKGRTRSRYPKWLTDHKETFPELLFATVEVDREDKQTEFEVRGFARTRAAAEHITRFVQKSLNTDSDTKITEHDFMKESLQNLYHELNEIFPDAKLNSIIRSLQTTKVYQIETEAVLAAESAVPGHLKTVLGDGFAVEVMSDAGVDDNGKFKIEINVFENEDGKNMFNENHLHLSTSLLTKLGQINMIGLRKRDERYILLFSVEELQPSNDKK